MIPQHTIASLGFRIHPSTTYTYGTYSTVLDHSLVSLSLTDSEYYILIDWLALPLFSFVVDHFLGRSTSCDSPATATVMNRARAVMGAR
jgi:hypothetical protein